MIKTIEFVSKCVIGLFGIVGILVFTLEHLLGYLERGGLEPTKFLVIMLCVVLPSWAFLSIRDSRKT